MLFLPFRFAQVLEKRHYRHVEIKRKPDDDKPTSQDLAGQQGLPSIRRRLLKMIDDEGICRSGCWFQLESELLLQSLEERGSVRIRLEIRTPVVEVH